MNSKSNDHTFASLLHTDLARYGSKRFQGLLKCFILHPEFRYIFWMRASAASKKLFVLFPLYLLCRLMLRWAGHKFGINIPYNTSIGPGFYIGHFGTIVVNPKVRIGRNCNISCGVVIGETYRGERKGVPTIGDYVYIAPGAKVIGKVTVGNNVAIGANCVVTRDLPDNAVAVGVPAKIISMTGSEGYITKVA